MESETPSARDQRNKRWRKRALKAGIGLGGALLVLALLIFVLPTPLARWVISSQLEALGIEHDGIDTVDIEQVPLNLSR